MINAWSLAAEVLEGTLDETYPIMKKAPINDRDDLKRESEYWSDCQHRHHIL